MRRFQFRSSAAAAPSATGHISDSSAAATAVAMTPGAVRVLTHSPPLTAAAAPAGSSSPLAPPAPPPPPSSSSAPDTAASAHLIDDATHAVVDDKVGSGRANHHQHHAPVGTTNSTEEEYNTAHTEDAAGGPPSAMLLAVPSNSSGRSFSSKVLSTAASLSTATVLKYVSLVALVFQTTAAVILTRFATMRARHDGSEPFFPVVLVAIQEALKTVLSLMLVAWQDYNAIMKPNQPRDASGTLSPLATPPGSKPTSWVTKAAEDGTDLSPSNAGPGGQSNMIDKLGDLPSSATGGGEEVTSAMSLAASAASDVPRGTLRERLRFLWVALYFYNVAQPLEAIKIAIPALLYTVQNNVIYIALEHLDATVFQVGYQSKVVVTGILTVLLIPGRHLSWRRWAALFLLSAGIVCAQLGERKSQPTSSAPITTTTTTTSPHDKEQSMTTGLVAVVVAAFCSGLAGVYFERVLKANPAHMQSTSELAMARSEKRFGRHCLELRRLVSDSKGSVCYAPPSVWMRNAQLGFFSFLIAVTGAEFFFQGQQQDAMRLAAENGVAYTATPVNRFQGFSSMVWCIIWIQAGGGLIIAMVIRYADNILKCFATAISIVVCGLCSSIFLHFLPSALFLLGSAVVIVATFVYSLSP